MKIISYQNITVFKLFKAVHLWIDTKLKLKAIVYKESKND